MSSCVICGAYVSEGNQVCSFCKNKILKLNEVIKCKNCAYFRPSPIDCGRYVCIHDLEWREVKEDHYCAYAKNIRKKNI